MTLAELQETLKNELSSSNTTRKNRVIKRIKSLLDQYNFDDSDEDKRIYDDLKDIKDALEKSDDNSDISELANKYLKIVDELETKCKEDSKNYNSDEWVYFKEINEINEAHYRLVNDTMTDIYYGAAETIFKRLEGKKIFTNSLASQVPVPFRIESFIVEAKTQDKTITIKVSPEGDTNDLNNLCPLSFVSDVIIKANDAIAYYIDADKCNKFLDDIEKEVSERYAK